MTDIGIRDISVSFHDNKISNISLVQGDALTRGFDITFVNAKGETLPVDDDYVVELVALNSKDKDTPYACRHEIVDDKYRVMIPPEALSESGSVTIQLVFYQKSTKAVIHTIKQKCPVYQSIGQEYVESNNLYIDITALRLGLEKIEKLDGKYEEIIEKDIEIQANEIDRKEAEKKRNLDEEIRKDNEAIRNSNEIKRENNEDIRIDNENKRVSAEADRTVVFDEMTESLEAYKTPLATDKVAGKVKVDKIPTESGEITVPSVGKLSVQLAKIQNSIDSMRIYGEFIGEVSAEDFISGDELAMKLGLSAGNSWQSEAGWLKFIYHKKVLYVAKRLLRNNISWNELYDAGLIYGDKDIDIGGRKYRVRLLRGIGEDVQPDPETPQSVFTGKPCHLSEWNALMCPISEKAPSSFAFSKNVATPVTPAKKTFTADEIFMDRDTICQDSLLISGEIKVSRRGGYMSCPSHSLYYGKDDKSALAGWRPVLELVD